MKPQVPGTFEEALSAVVHYSEKSPKELASLLGIAYSTLCNCANPDCDCNLRASQVLPATLFSNNYAILDYFERGVNRVAFAIPKPTGSVRALHSHLGSTVDEFGRLLEKFAEVIADGKITRG